MTPVSAVRSRNMARIKAKNTKPEVSLRKALHGLGFRFRLHNRSLPGTPDIVLTKWRAVIFVNGCFWHGHDCKDFRWPKTRNEFWRNKIGTNVARDRANVISLLHLGWRVAVVWECSFKREKSATPVASALSVWLKSDVDFIALRENFDV